MKHSRLVKRLAKFAGSFVLCGVLFSSCVYDKEFSYLNDQIIALNRRVTTLQDAQDSVDKKVGQDLDARMQSIRSRQADAVADLESLKAEIRELSGRMDDSEHIVKRTVERDLGDQDAMKRTLEDLSKRVSVLEMTVGRQQEYLGLEPPPPIKSDEPSTKVAEGPEEKASTPEIPVSDDTALYDHALALFRDGKFEDSMESFEDFLKKYPKSDRADNAQFWIGESFMALKHYEQAILAYQKVIKKYPKGNKVANAMLRQAMAFLEIKDKTSTKLLLRKIIKTYPKSNEAQIAKKKLKTIK